MKKLIVAVLIAIPVFFFSEAIQAVDTGKIIAYPVPFNPRKGDRVLTIEHKSGLTNYRVKVEIFHVNGDLVFKRKFGLLPAYWNGHNDRGNLVKPGFYIMMLDIEGTLTDHSQGKKMIRILVNY
ncbi:MAG TPA: hypothetical protein PK573_15895 [Spirochaetota bacterium]|nr:hypothetical protein [Spirochaetota bacterium]